MNDASTKTLVEWSLDNNCLGLADAFAEGWASENDADRNKYSLRWKLALLTDSVRKCIFSDAKSFKDAFTALNKLETAATQNLPDINIIKSELLNLKTRVLTTSCICLLVNHLDHEFDHQNEIVIPSRSSLQSFDSNAWKLELQMFFKSTAVSTAFNIRVAIKEHKLVPLDNSAVDAWDTSLTFLTDNLLSEARTSKEEECPTITRVALLLENFRLSTLQYATDKLVGKIKLLMEIEKPVLIFTVPTSSMLQKQKKDYQLNKIPSLENDEGSGSSSTRKRKIVEQKGETPLGLRYDPNSARAEHRDFWTDEETDALLVGIKRHGFNWCKIVDDLELHKVLYRRHNMQCRDKYVNEMKKKTALKEQQRSVKLRSEHL